MKKATIPFILALASVIVSPILLVLELSALFFAGMVASEPANSILVRILAVVIVFLIGLSSLLLPAIAFRMGARARMALKLSKAGGSGLAIAAMVIAGIVAIGVVLAQIYFILMVVGI